MNTYDFVYGTHKGAVMAATANRARAIIRDTYGHGLGDMMISERMP